MAQPLLEGEVEYLDSKPTADLRLEEHSRMIGELEDRIAALEAKVANNKRDAVVALLQMLADSIRHIASGKMDIPEPSNFGQPAAPQSSPKWEAWKQRLGGKAAEFITQLLIHGEMTGQQLKVATKCGQQTVYDTIAKLNKAQLLQKNGGRYSLKEN